MRNINFLLFAFFTVVSVGSFASDQTQSASSAQPNLLQNPSQSMVVNKFQMPPATGRLKKPSFGRRIVVPEESVCYVLDTYIVKREAANSEVTQAAGYSTCSPSSRYSVKEAVDVTDLPTQ